MQPRDYQPGYPQQQPVHQQQYQPQQQQPVHQQQYQPQHQQIVVQQSSKGMNPLFIVGGVIGGIVIIIVLAGVLYVWANSLAEDELEGTWHAEDGEWIEFSSGNSFDCEDCNFDEWIVPNSGEVAFCNDSPNAQGGGCDGSWYYTYEYEVKGDVLFMAPHDSGGNVQSGACAIFVKSGNSYYNTANSEPSPYWCDA